MYKFLCHAKKWIMAMKGGGTTFSCSRGGGAGDWKCFNCGKVGCEVRTCNKPLDKELITRSVMGTGKTRMAIRVLEERRR